MVDSAKIGTKEFGDLLRTARERKGMSRNDLVEATGLSYPYISQLETAYRKPSPAAIQKLADALDISLDDIFAAMTKPAAQPLSTQALSTQALSKQEHDEDSGWIANKSFAGPPVSAPAPMRFAAAAGRPAPAPQSPALPAGPASAAGESATQDGSVVEQVVTLLVSLPAEQRLDVLAKIQAEVVGSVIDDGIRRGRSTS